jgi:hypothetical protein
MLEEHPIPVGQVEKRQIPENSSQLGKGGSESTVAWRENA